MVVLNRLWILCAFLGGSVAHAATIQKGQLQLESGDIITVVQAREAVRGLAQETCKEDGYRAISYGVEITSVDSQDLYRGTFQCLEDATGMERITIYTVMVGASGNYQVILVPQRFESVH